MFIAALFTVARTWKQPQCPQTDEWIKKMWHIYTMEYYSAIKKNEIELFVVRWMDQESVTQSEVSLKEKNKQPSPKMGRSPKQTFLQRRYTDCQQTPEKMLNITNHQRNANQNYNEVSPHTSQNGHYQKIYKQPGMHIKNKNREPSCNVGGNVNWCRYCGKQYRGSLKN